MPVNADELRAKLNRSTLLSDLPRGELELQPIKVAKTTPAPRLDLPRIDPAKIAAPSAPPERIRQHRTNKLFKNSN